jgi:hypothetical protein
MFSVAIHSWLVVALIMVFSSMGLKKQIKINAISSAALVLAVIITIGISQLFPGTPNIPTIPNPITPPSAPNEPVNPTPGPTTPSDPAVPSPAPTTPRPATPTPAPAQPNQPRNNFFVMGEDNFSFANTSSSFGYSRNYGIPVERFRLIFSHSESETLSRLRGYSPWGGNCYGFAATSSLFDKGVLQHSNYQAGVRTTFNFGFPRTNRALLELIELYQISQSLTEVSRAARANTNNYNGLIVAMHNADGTVKRNGLIVSVRNSDGGHAVIAYDIRNVGNGIYSLSIYDNNYPNDRNRTMVVDTARLAWTYYGRYTSSTHEFRFLDSSVVYSNVQAAIARQSNPSLDNRTENDMRVIIPDGVSATQNGIPITEIEGAFDMTPDTNAGGTLAAVWYIPDNDIVNFEVPGKADGIAVFDEFVSYMVTADTATVAGSTMTGIIVDTDNKFEIIVVWNDNEPLTLSGVSSERFTVSDEDGEIVMTGSGRIRAQQGNRRTTLTLESGSQTVFDESALKTIIPWYVFAIVGLVLVAGVVLVVWKIKSKR